MLELQRWSSREVPVGEGYARWADVYDDDRNPTRDADAALVRRWLPSLGELDVLELGCGTGKKHARARRREERHRARRLGGDDGEGARPRCRSRGSCSTT